MDRKFLLNLTNQQPPVSSPRPFNPATYFYNDRIRNDTQYNNYSNHYNNNSRPPSVTYRQPYNGYQASGDKRAHGFHKSEDDSERNRFGKTVWKRQ